MAWITAAAMVGSALLGSQASKKAAGQQGAGAEAATAAQMEMFRDTKKGLAPYERTGRLSLNELSRLVGLPGYGQQEARKGVVDEYVNTIRQQLAARGESLNEDWARSWDLEPDEAVIQRLLKAKYPDGMVPEDDDFGMLTKPFTLADFQESPAYQFNLAEGEKALNKAASARKMTYAPSTLKDIARFSQGLASNEFQNAYNNYNTNMGNIWSRLYSLSGSGQNAAANTGAFGTNVAGNIGNNIIGAANASAAGTVGAANAVTGAAGNAYNAYLMNQILRSQQPTYTGPGGKVNWEQTGDFADSGTYT